MRATQTLPENYRCIGTLDVLKDRRALVILNLLGLLVLGLSGWLFFRAMFWLRPEDVPGALGVIQISGPVGWIGLVAAVLGLTALHVVLHEAIHGVCFWLFTRTRPRFAFRWAYAYAAAPDWFIPRDAFLVTTLAPLVAISLGGLALIAVVPPAWILPTWFVITMNAGGAVGDIVVAIWLLRQPRDCFARDRGDAVSLFVPIQGSGR